MLACSISSTISRLKFLPKPWHPSALTSLRTLHRAKTLLLKTQWSLATSSPRRSSSSSTLNSAAPSEEISGYDELVVLGIETSCDDTAAAIVRGNGEILSQVVSSQGVSVVIAIEFNVSLHRNLKILPAHIGMSSLDKLNTRIGKLPVDPDTYSMSVKADLLAKYGGVDPKMAGLAHAGVIDKVVQEAFDKANLSVKDISAVAVTIGPGLSLCLRVGVQKAWSIAGHYKKPIIRVHHMEAHALVARLVDKELQFPFLALLISGGHNLLVLARNLGQYVQLGTTIDDAIGEAYDKTAKWLGLDLRKCGGPAVEELALDGDANSVKFSTPMKQHKDCNFSYAGLKTQVRLAIETKKIDAGVPVCSAIDEDRQARADIAASFQRVAVLHLEEKCERAIEWAMEIEPALKYMVVSGGVASNKYVRARLDAVVERKNLQLVCPPPRLCTDNGVMVAWTGIEQFRVGRYDPPPPAQLPEDYVYDLRPRWPLAEEYEKGRSEARSLRTARIHPSLTSMVQASSQQQQQH